MQAWCVLNIYNLPFVRWRIYELLIPAPGVSPSINMAHEQSNTVAHGALGYVRLCVSLFNTRVCAGTFFNIDGLSYQYGTRADEHGCTGAQYWTHVRLCVSLSNTRVCLNLNAGTFFQHTDYLINMAHEQSNTGASVLSTCKVANFII